MDVTTDGMSCRHALVDGGLTTQGNDSKKSATVFFIGECEEQEREEGLGRLGTKVQAGDGRVEGEVDEGMEMKGGGGGGEDGGKGGGEDQEEEEEGGEVDGGGEESEEEEEEGCSGGVGGGGEGNEAEDADGERDGGGCGGSCGGGEETSGGVEKIDNGGREGLGGEEQSDSVNNHITAPPPGPPPAPPPPPSSSDQVLLPLRYRRQLKARKPEAAPPDGDDISEDDDVISDNWRDREQDLDMALKWLRQEISFLKQQDKALMRQLLDLRASIHQLRGFRSCRSFGSMAALGLHSDDVTASWPLDMHDYDALSEPCAFKDSPAFHRDIVMGFQNRTVSMVSMSQDSPDKSYKLIQFGHSHELFL